MPKILFEEKKKIIYLLLNIIQYTLSHTELNTISCILNTVL